MSQTPFADRLAFYEIVIFAHDDPEFAEVNGLRGYVAGKGSPEPDEPPPPDDGRTDEVAVFFYDIERVWCVPAAHCRSTGAIDHEVKAHFEWARRKIDEKYARLDAEQAAARDKS